MRRSLKSQIRKDAKRVFLNLENFAVLTRILYWRHGNSREPEDRRIAIVIDEDGNENRGWNRNKVHQNIGNDHALFQVSLAFFCALEDFNPPPKKKREIQVGDHVYEVVGVEVIEGMLRVELRELEE